MNIPGFILTLTLCSLILMLSRRGAALAVVAGVCWITQGQQWDVIGFHLTAIRILLLTAAIRILVRGDWTQIRIKRMDKVLVAYALTIAVVSMMRDGVGNAFAYRMGGLYDTLLSYFVFRSLISDLAELEGVLKGAPFIILPMVTMLSIEKLTGRNWFSIFGGVSLNAWVRDGGLRCMGPFRNPITAGSVGATLAPLFLGLSFSRSSIKAGLFGIVLCTVIVIDARSSGPLIAYLSAFFGWLCFYQRAHIQMIRRIAAIAVIALHLIMKAPVWFLLGRVSDVVGGGGYYRAEIIDAFVRRFPTWWLMGVTDTSDWMPTGLNGGADITNRFVADGINGGLIGLLLMIWLLTLAFKALGEAMKKLDENEEMNERMFWCLGVALFAHIVNQISVTYFDQSYVLWYMLLAVIASCTTWEVNYVNDEEGEEEEEVAPLMLVS